MMKSNKYRVEFSMYNGFDRYDLPVVFGVTLSGENGEREILLKLQQFIDDRIAELESEDRSNFDDIFGDDSENPPV